MGASPSLTFNAQLKADVAEGQGACVCFQLADTADVVVIQINVHKLLLFVHSTTSERNRDKQSTRHDMSVLHNLQLKLCSGVLLPYH